MYNISERSVNILEYVVIDLEFNQPFAFSKGRKTVLVPECPFEVIQIGAVKMNADFEIIDSCSFLSKPSVYKRIHPFVKKITGLGSESFSQQQIFPEVYETFVEFLGNEEYVFCVWGGGDMRTLFDNIKYYKLENRLTDKYIDVQKIAGRKLETIAGNSVGLKAAVESFGLEINENFHDALNDARYTAKIFQMLREEETVIQTYTPVEREQNHGPDFTRLYEAAEKEFGRKITKKERRIVRTIYMMGRAQIFDRTLGPPVIRRRP